MASCGKGGLPGRIKFKRSFFILVDIVCPSFDDNVEFRASLPVHLAGRVAGNEGIVSQSVLTKHPSTSLSVPGSNESISGDAFNCPTVEIVDC